ncbi:MAG: hypothetical protein CSA94_00905 [Bacteroidetes bacterium]|nr:MAG: hypothetical protein CSA94_00905 [Bacteroidota bacterium]
MKGNTLTDNRFNSGDLFVFLLRYKKTFLIITLFALLGAILFSSPLFITPKYKSEVILYPAASNAISNALLVENNNKNDVLSYGEETATEQLMQLLESSRIRDKVIREFDLLNHYKINPNGKHIKRKLFKTYKQNITISRTKYAAVKISVLDTDPKLAAKIANRISDIIDSVKADISKNRALSAYHIVKKEYEEMLADIQQMEDSLTQIRQLGIHDYKSQAEMLNQQLAKEIAKNNKPGIQALEKKLSILAKYGSGYVGLSQQLEYDREKLSDLKRNFEKAKVDAFEVLPQHFVIEKAYQSDRKEYPIRWLIVLTTLISTWFTTTIVIILLSKYKKQ